jgi:hypothetical protein
MEAYLRVQSADCVASELAALELSDYCRVDTVAMVFVYDFWMWRLTADDPMDGPLIELKPGAVGDGGNVAP